MKIKSLNILKITIAVLLCLNFFSCSEEDDVQVPICRVENFRVVNMFYDEFLRTMHGTTSDGKIYLEYDALGRINRVIGGLLYQPFPFVNTPFMMSSYVEEEVIYEGNKITVDSYRMYKKEFEIQDGILLSQKTTYAQSFDIFLLADYCSEVLYYEYQDNLILEKENGLVRRIFHLENGNLVQVELFLRNYNLENIGKIEYILSEYDSTPNLLKGKFFIHGNFFKAFNNNNYKSFLVRRYDYVDGDYVLSQFGNLYNSSYENLPNDLFVEDCQ